MFNDLFKLATRRSGLQALGFYIAYFLLFIVCGGLIGGLTGAVSGGGFQAGLRAGQVFAIVACPGLAFAVLKAKGAFTFGHVLLALLSGLLAALGGGLLGLIPVSFLTTRAASGGQASLPDGGSL